MGLPGGSDASAAASPCAVAPEASEVIAAGGSGEGVPLLALRWKKRLGPANVKMLPAAATSEGVPLPPCGGLPCGGLPPGVAKRLGRKANSPKSSPEVCAEGSDSGL